MPTLNILWNTTVAGGGGGGGGGESATVTLRNGVDGAIAPAAFEFGVDLVGFDAVAPSGGNVYDERLHDLKYLWTVSDNYDFAAPEKTLDGTKNNGTHYGPRIATVIRSTAPVTVSCLVIEPSSGKFATTPNFTINLTDPETAFAGADTIYVDPDAVYTNAPAGATLRDNIADAWSLCINQEATDKRIMLRNGVTHTAGGLSVNGQNHPTVHIVAEPGGQADWTQTSTGFISNPTGSRANRNIVFQNIDFQGPFDAATNTGASVDLMECFQRSVSGALVYDGCGIDGFDFGPHTTGDVQENQTIALNDCIGTNWRGLISYNEAGQIYAIGNRFFQKLGALGHYNVGNIPNTAIRCTKALTSIVQHNDLHAANGWVFNITGIATPQAAVRFMTSPQRGAFVNLSGNVMEGGYNCVDVQSHVNPGETIQSQQCNFIMHGNFGMMNGFGTTGVSFGHSGLTMESNIMMHVDAERLDPTFDPFTFVSFAQAPDGIAGDLAAAPNRVRGNTFINLITPANAGSGTASPIPIISNSSGVTVDEGNNINHQPNVTGPITVSNLDTTNIFTARYQGYRDDDTALTPGNATPPTTPATYRQLAGSAAIGAATGTLAAYQIPTFDILLQQRTGATHDAGAFADVA